MSRILIVNKFLYPNGGSETYIFELGKQLKKEGHKVQYFGMEDTRNIVGNDIQSYTSNMDFHTGKSGKLIYPFKIIYSREARKAIRKVLDDFNPEVVHLNNFNFQITPSIIYEIRKYGKQIGQRIKIIFTAHDYQLICPNHMMRCPKTEENCSRCIDGAYGNCFKESCIHNSKVKSLLGTIEATLYKKLKTYKYIDCIICPSKFMQNQMEHNTALRDRTVYMQNFTTIPKQEQVRETQESVQDKYVLYFGRYSKEKGVETLLKVCKELSHVRFVFAGKGPLEDMVNEVNSVENKGFLTSEELRPLIQGAAFSIYPSEWYENGPFSIMESIQYGTPVIGAAIGGIPELIDDGETGELFESGNIEQLREKISRLWGNEEIVKQYRGKCLERQFLTVGEYCRELTKCTRD